MRSEPRVLHTGRWLRLISRGGWEYVERIHSRGVVVILAVTPRNELLLVEQFRPAVQAPVIEMPAGLVGDEAAHADENLIDAARRELVEETGYEAERLEILASGPASPGQSSESMHMLRAHGLRRVSAGGGVDDEDIRVHEIALDTVADWLLERQKAGALVDLKLYAGLHLLGEPRCTGS